MNQEKDDDEMRPEYDFSQGKRGKFHRPLAQGYIVRVRRSDGSEIVRRLTPSNVWQGVILSRGEEQLRRLCAKRGLDWDTMSAEEREGFVNRLLYEK